MFRIKKRIARQNSLWRKACESAKGKGLELKDPEDLRDAVRKECKKRKITFEQNVMDDKQNLNRFAGPRVGYVTSKHCLNWVLFRHL